MHTTYTKYIPIQGAGRPPPLPLLLCVRCILYYFDCFASADISADRPANISADISADISPCIYPYISTDTSVDIPADISADIIVSL